MTPACALAADSVGVGLLLNAAVPALLSRRPDCIDYLSVVPDTLQVDRGRGRTRRDAPRFFEVESLVAIADEIAGYIPLVAHGVGLSIGSPGALDAAYVERMKYWADHWQLAWYSEHLSFFRLARGSTAAHEAGLAVALPLDRAVLRAVARKAAAVQARLGVPFLLENGVSYTRPLLDDFSEPEFLSELAQRSGTGLLLDLHNLYTNARNHGTDACAELDRLALGRVVEVHVAGGEMLEGMYSDAHSGAVPAEVWKLLDHALPRLHALRGVTFEFHESCLPRLGEQGVFEQLERIRASLGARGVGRTSGACAAAAQA